MSHRLSWCVLIITLSVIAAVSVLHSSYVTLPVMPGWESGAGAAAARPADRSRRTLSTTRLYRPAGQQTCHIPPSVNQVMMVRLCGLLNKSLRDSLAKYAREVLQHEAYDLWFLYDTGPESSSGFNESLAEPLLELQKEHPGLGLLFYNSDSVLRLYPQATLLREKSISKNDLNFWFHDASLVLWARLCHPDFFVHNSHLPAIKRYVWLIEADALFTGDITSFLADHANRTEDYLGWYGPMPADWYHRGGARWFIPEEKTIKKEQQAERYSLSLVWYLNTLIRLNVLAYGEVYATTVCAQQADWCRMAQLDPSFRGSRLAWDTLLSDEGVEALWQNPSEQGKWHHAVRSRKGQGCVSSLYRLEGSSQNKE